jgi:antagonist of KipI
LFDANRAEPALLRTGDRVRFTAVERIELPDAAAEPAPAGEAAIRVLRAGLHTSVQDLGREGWRAAGVGPGGAGDEMAARIANLLVGNPEDAAGIEFTLNGPELRFERDAWIAVGGGEFAGVASWTPLRVAAGSTLRIGEARRGCRGFLAVAGGIAVESVLGSRSVHLRAGFGGGFGRALRAGDGLPVGPSPGGGPHGRWRIDPRLLPRYAGEAEVRLIAAPESQLPAEGAVTPWFTISSRSDRMGVRLEGEALPGAWSGERVSSPVAPGTVQVPPDGRPIVLLADAQTIGGYPVLGQVAAVDLPVLAQLRPGDRLRFRGIPLAEARERLAAREHGLAMLAAGLKEKRA